MARALSVVARDCETDASLRCVILTGSGRFFSAGGDVRSFEAAQDALPELLRELTLYLHGALSSFARMNAPLVTAINGVTAGGGLGLAVAGDLCIAARSATFKSAFTALGISPDSGSTFWLPRLIGMRRAQELFLTNIGIDAERALQWGLVTEVVDDARLRERSREAAAQLASLPAAAMAATRRLLLETFQADHTEQLDRESRSITALARDAETKARIDAFIAKSRASRAAKGER